MPHGGSVIGSSRQSHQRIEKLVEKNQKANWQRKCAPSRRYDVLITERNNTFRSRKERKNSLRLPAAALQLLLTRIVGDYYLFSVQDFRCRRERQFIFMSSKFTMTKFFTSSFHFSRPGVCVRMPHKPSTQNTIQICLLFWQQWFVLLLALNFIHCDEASALPAASIRSTRNVFSASHSISRLLFTVAAQTLTRTHAQTNPTQRLFVSSHFSLSCTRRSSSPYTILLGYIVMLKEESDITSVIIIIFRLFSAFYFILCNYLAFSRRLFQRSSVFFLLSHTLFSFSRLGSCGECRWKKKIYRKSQKKTKKIGEICAVLCCNPNGGNEIRSFQFVNLFPYVGSSLCLVWKRRRTCFHKCYEFDVRKRDRFLFWLGKVSFSTVKCAKRKQWFLRYCKHERHAIHRSEKTKRISTQTHQKRQMRKQKLANEQRRFSSARKRIASMHNGGKQCEHLSGRPKIIVFFILVCHYGVHGGPHGVKLRVSSKYMIDIRAFLFERPSMGKQIEFFSPFVSTTSFRAIFFLAKTSIDAVNPNGIWWGKIYTMSLRR